MDAAKKLDKARIDRSLVDVHRNPRSSETVWGYVSAVGKKWALIANARDGGYPDGFTAIRLKDVIAVRRRAGFEDAFAKTRTDWPETPLHLDLEAVLPARPDVGLVATKMLRD